MGAAHAPSPSAAAINIICSTGACRPRWNDCSGWLNRDSVHWFVAYLVVMFKKALHNRVPRWTTLNEPRVVSAPKASAKFYAQVIASHDAPYWTNKSNRGRLKGLPDAFRDPNRWDIYG
jgi:hypothetical protein